MNLLERGLLSKPSSCDEDSGSEDETILYTASFQEMEDNFVKYQTAQWVLYSVLLILAWGFGLSMLLYLPVRRHILRKDIQSRKLYVTPNAIVYKVTLQALQLSCLLICFLCAHFNLNMLNWKGLNLIWKSNFMQFESFGFVLSLVV